MKRKSLLFLLVMTLCVGTASAQFGAGIVYDPTNYSNALLRYYQLQQHLLQLRASYAQLVAQYNFAVQMARNIKKMPARYRLSFPPGATAPRSTPSETREPGSTASIPARPPLFRPATSKPQRSF